MKAFLKHFYTGRGWAHFIFATALFYKFMYFGMVPGKGFWHTMAKSFMEAYTFHWSGAFGCIIGAWVIYYCIGFFIEEAQAVVFGAKRDVFDERWTSLGSPGAVLLYAIFKVNSTLNLICSIMLIAIAIYVIVFVAKRAKYIWTKLIGKSKA